MLQTVERAGRLTYDDLVRLYPEGDGLRHELIDGVHYVTPSAVTRHQRLVGRLFLCFAQYLDAHPSAGEAFLAPFDVVFTPYDVIEPDLLFIADDQPGILTEKNVQGAPAIVVEIFSPGTKRRDRTLKRRLFEREGVREYWMLDPVRNRVEICRRSPDSTMPLVADLAAADTLTTPLLPGFSIDLATFFR